MREDEIGDDGEEGERTGRKDAGEAVTSQKTGGRNVIKDEEKPRIVARTRVS
jgi:hypothetical protein